MINNIGKTTELRYRLVIGKKGNKGRSIKQPDLLVKGKILYTTILIAIVSNKTKNIH